MKNIPITQSASVNSNRIKNHSLAVLVKIITRCLDVLKVANITSRAEYEIMFLWGKWRLFPLRSGLDLFLTTAKLIARTANHVLATLRIFDIKQSASITAKIIISTASNMTPREAFTPLQSVLQILLTAY